MAAWHVGGSGVDGRASRVDCGASLERRPVHLDAADLRNSYASQMRAECRVAACESPHCARIPPLAVLVMGARCSLRSAEWESAERIFAAGVRDNAGNQKLWAMLGDVILREGGAERLPEAEAAFERALALEPDDFKMHYSLARTSGLQGRHREAAERFARAASVGEIFAPHLTGPMYAAHCFNKAGEEARSAGDRFLAQELYRRGLELAEAADNAEERRIATNNLQALIIS